MSNPQPNITIPVDLANPGQFFACCGLLELADRLWPGAEAWFAADHFCVRFDGNLRTLLTYLILDPPQALSFVCETLPVKPIVAPLALTFDADTTDRFVLDFWTKVITKSGSVQAVAAPPWNMWSGNQKSLPIWLQLRDELRVLIAGDETTKTHACKDSQLLNLFRQTRPLTGRFGFDSTAAWNAQDVGFSPNDQGMAVESSPATELLAAVGLQRIRPVIDDGIFQYQLWNNAASPAIAAAFACGGIPHSGTRYRFEIINRGQYSAIGKARSMKGDSVNVPTN
ncbi:MAG TPA: hypothetical protein VFE47_13475 [Tepidisphaeraceae bacterium]|jgi:CRISPR-associated protein Csx14|nr:hypothetical protein [Tepidisphaeraceae bacterium]